MQDKKKMPSREEIMKCLMSGQSIKDLIGVDDERMNELISKSENFISSGEFSAANDLSTILTVMDPYNKKVWRCDALSSFHLGNIDKSSASISFAIAVDPEDIILRVDCCKILNKTDKYEELDAEKKLVEFMLDNADSSVEEKLYKDHGMSLEEVKEYYESIKH